MPMSKGNPEILTNVQGKQKNIPEVHKSCAKVDYTQDTLVTIEINETENIMEEEEEDDNGTERQNVNKNKRFTKLYKIVFVPQQIDTSNIPGPVSRAEQLLDYKYCNQYNKNI